MNKRTIILQTFIQKHLNKSTKILNKYFIKFITTIMLLFTNFSFAYEISRTIELPTGFEIDVNSKNVINDAGQIAGGVATISNNGQKKKYHAALWDPCKGIIRLDTTVEGISNSLNNEGNVALSLLSLNLQYSKQTYYWEPSNGE